jgi:hypothetical protein
VFRLSWNRCPAYKKSSNQSDNSLQKPVLYGSLVSEFGGVKITLLCRLVKSGVGKTRTAVDKMGRNEVGKESLKDMFLPVFKGKNF